MPRTPTFPSSRRRQSAGNFYVTVPAMKIKFIALLLLVVLLPSCTWRTSPDESAKSINRSSLYDPPQVTLLDGVEYQFVEGRLTGGGQKFHSEFWYVRALTIGDTIQNQKP